jgi:uncharacterized membrane protein YqiK
LTEAEALRRLAEAEALRRLAEAEWCEAESG